LDSLVGEAPPPPLGPQASAATTVAVTASKIPCFDAFCVVIKNPPQA